MTTVKTFKNYINGQWLETNSKRTFEQRNPARLSEITGRFQHSSEDDALEAIAAAQAAFPLWRSLTSYQRAENLRRVLDLIVRRKEEICNIITLENGKIISDSVAEIEEAIHEMDFQINEGLRIFGEIAPLNLKGVFAYTLKEPLGVVSIISPWNFPFNVPIRKIIPALMAGNTCVFKPASLTAQTGCMIAKLFEDADVAPGVFNMLTGSGNEVGDTIISDPRIRAVSFTGSTVVGMEIQRKSAANATRTQLEMGGKNATVVLEDADIESAVNAIVKAAYACSGQWCTSTSRVIVVNKVAQEITEKLVDATQSIIVGNGFDKKAGMGPVCGRAQLETILKYIEYGKKEGAKLLTGGNRIFSHDLEDGCFIEPAIFGEVRPDMKIAQDEIFGPVLSIINVEDLDEAIKVSNNSKFGLCSSIFTDNIKYAMKFIEQSEVGLTHLNLMTSFKTPKFPFGGIKGSGIGLPEAGKTGIEFFLRYKTVYIKHI